MARPRISRARDKRFYPLYYKEMTTEEYVRRYYEKNAHACLSKCAYIINGKEVVA